MRYGLDMLYPPSRTAAEIMQARGWQWLNVYIGGPRATARNSWQIREGVSYPVADVAPYFEGFLPLYVGRNAPWDRPGDFNYQQGIEDGDEANELTGACGFDSNTVLGLDLEYGTWQAAPHGAEEYVRGWVERVNAAGHPGVLYSDIETLNHLDKPELIDFVWGAAWIGGTNFENAPLGQFDPSWPPPWDVWQFGSGRIGGIQCDCNSSTDAFPLAAYGPA